MTRATPRNRIVTVTMNPSLDLFGETREVVDDGKSRCGPAQRLPGGGGINVARNLHRMGLDVLAVFTAGGLNGDALTQMLTDEALPHRRIPVDGETRQSLAVTEQASGRMYHFVFPGPELTRDEWQQGLSVLEKLEPAPALLVLSGSLPEGVPDDFYARIVASLNGSRVILDTSGRALKAPIEAGVHVAKLNRNEFADLGYAGPPDHGSMLAEMGRIVEQGHTHALIVTLDAGGALLATADGQRLHVKPPPTAVVSHVGAGDSFVSVLARRLHEDYGMREAFRYGVAAAAAKVNTPGNQLTDMDKVERIHAQLEQYQL